MKSHLQQICFIISSSFLSAFHRNISFKYRSLDKHLIVFRGNTICTKHSHQSLVVSYSDKKKNSPIQPKYLFEKLSNFAGVTKLPLLDLSSMSNLVQCRVAKCCDVTVSWYPNIIAGCFNDKTCDHAITRKTYKHS